ncbi:MAG: acyl-CoA thioesterase [Acidimicrobiales bacterium]
MVTRDDGAADGVDGADPGALEAAMSVKPQEPGAWSAYADPRFETAGRMFGGWTSAVLLRAVRSTAEPELDPLNHSVHYLQPVTPGTDVVVHTSHLGGTRSIDHWQATMLAGEGADVTAVATVALGRRRVGERHTEPTMPDAPDPDIVAGFRPPGPVGRQSIGRNIPEGPPFGRGDTRSISWVRDLTGRAVDHEQLAYLSDCHIPRIFFWSDDHRPMATVTMSVTFLATDDELAAVGDDYLLSEASGTRGADSICGEQIRLWSRAGILLATSEQLTWYR